MMTSRTIAAAAAGLMAVGALVAISPSAEAAPTWRTYVGQGSGMVPDAPGGSCGAVTGAPLDVTFNVQGAPRGIVDDIRLEKVGITTNYIGDLKVVLIAPNGVEVSIFGITGRSTSALSTDNSNAAGLYAFNDDPASEDWWPTASGLDNASAMPNWEYRASASGGPTVAPEVAGSTVSMAAAVTTVANPNGTWTLRFTDTCSGDQATIAAGARLQLRMAPGCSDETTAQAEATERVADAEAALAAANAGVTKATKSVDAAKATQAKAAKALVKAKKVLAKAKKSKKATAIAKATKKVAAATAADNQAKHKVALSNAALTLATTVRSDAEGDVADATALLAHANADKQACLAS